MADTFDPTDPRHLTTEQRFDELASILATGLRRALAARPIFTSPESGQNQLDVSPQTSVHAPVQLTQTESAQGAGA
jgi:hypothetical protein